MDESREFPFETAVEIDLFQYLSPDQARQTVDDTTLAAFAQVAALRLNTTRAFISLVDRTSQYILLEATQKSCLAPDSSGDRDNDGLLFGRATLPRSQGLCGHALDLLSPGKASVYQAAWQSPLVVNDLSRDDHFKNQPFVISHPSIRFYAAMPICTESGVRCGVLSVMDERPREGLGDLEAKLLTDLASAVAAHLESTRSNEGHRRSEKMIKGLGLFMQGRTDLGDWWLELGKSNARQQQEPEDIADMETDKATVPDSAPKSVPTRHISPGAAAGEEDSAESSSSDDQSGPLVSGLAGLKLEATDSMERSSPPFASEEDDAVRTALHSTENEPHLTFTTFEASEHAHASPQTSSAENSTSTLSLAFEGNLVSKRLKKMFARACHIIQDCLEVDGAIFLDASISTLTEHPVSRVSGERPMLSRSSTSNLESLQVETDHRDDGTYLDKESSVQNQESTQRPCGVLGFCTGVKSSMHGEMASTLKPLTEAFLQGLLQKYPQGHVFNRDKRRQPVSDARDPDRSSQGLDTPATSASPRKAKLHAEEPEESAEDRALLQMLPDTKSIAFIPLWDSHRERWFAGSFMWTVERTTRVLTHSEDLQYLAAFGTCIMAEVARLDVVGADRAKSDFISSISHELRSPLHGILASVELLQDTPIDSFQHNMIETIERCGRTLLDTIQQVLDFAKINNFTSFKGEERAKGGPGLPRSPSELPGLSADIDLSVLTEDVVDSVFAGHEFRGNSSHEVPDQASGHIPEDVQGSSNINMATNTVRNLPTPKKAWVDVIMDIGWRPDWVFSTQSGALRRILMNLFGNALKYTDSGWVKVSLQAEDIESAPYQPKRSVITISVRDTGRGISPDYFHSGLFTPFTQEDSMNSGTGLGLSIVLQIVRSLGGTLDITSEQGVGTEVVVTLTLNQAPLADPPSLHRESTTMIQNTRRLTGGLTIGIIGFDDSSSTVEGVSSSHKSEAEPVLFIEASIEETAIQWFDMKVAAPPTWKSSPPDIYVANETTDLGNLAGVPTIVLCSHEALHREYGEKMARTSRSGDNDVIHLVSKPCGPHKLAKAFAFCLNTAPSQSSPSENPSSTLASPQSLFQPSPDSRVFSKMGSRTEHRMSDDYFQVGTASPTSPPLTRDTDGHLPEKRKPMLLLVEDNEINLRLLSMFVKKNNYEYDTAENGLLAFEAVREARTPYDIIFMDISMPIMDGIAATRKIRELERSRAQKACKIIALTGLGSTDSRREAFSSGVDLFLTKPVRLSDLRKILQDWTGDDVSTGG